MAHEELAARSWGALQGARQGLEEERARTAAKDGEPSPGAPVARGDGASMRHVLGDAVRLPWARAGPGGARGPGEAGHGSSRHRVTTALRQHHRGMIHSWVAAQCKKLMRLLSELEQERPHHPAEGVLA